MADGQHLSIRQLRVKAIELVIAGIFLKAVQRSGDICSQCHSLLYNRLDYRVTPRGLTPDPTRMKGVGSYSTISNVHDNLTVDILY